VETPAPVQSAHDAILQVGEKLLLAIGDQDDRDGAPVVEVVQDVRFLELINFVEDHHVGSPS